MKKFYVLKIMMAVMLTMLMTVGNVFADKGWVKVTHNTTLSVGDSIIIAAANYDKAISTQQNNNNRPAVNITKVGNQATFTTNVQVFVLQQSTIDNAFVLFDPDNSGGYLNAPGDGNYMHTDATLPTNGSGDWVISVFDNDSITIIAQNSSITQVYMRYNSGSNLFSCYAVGSSVKNAVTIYRYEEVEEPTVAIPMFSHEAGVLYAPENITISCATDGATILYTVDGSNPKINGTLYTAPIPVSTNTTLKAVAISGTDTSDVNEVTYTFPVEVANIAAFKADNTTTNSTVYKITGPVIHVFHSGAYTYVKDASAGLLIYDNTVITNEYDEGDVILGGICGTYTKYNGQIEFIPTVNPDEAAQNIGTVQPVVVTMAELLANYEDYDAQLITLQNVTFNGFSGNSATITQGESSMTLYKRFAFTTTMEAGTVCNVTGFAAKYGTAIQIYPRNSEDLVAGAPMPSLTVTGIADGDEYSTLDTLHVSFDIQNFALTNILGMGGDGYLKLEGALFAAVGLDNPMYLNATTLPYFSTAVLSPIPAGTHTVTASLVDLNQQPLDPAVSQTVTFTVIAPAAEAPVFSPVAGPYTDNVEITLTCATPGAEIRYTIDNTTPTATSTLYQNPFTLNETATVKAKAFMNSQYWEDSPVAEATYSIVSEPTLTVNPTSLTFTSDERTRTVNISSASLTAPIVISCNHNHFTLSDTTFPATVGNTSFTVTYVGLEPATASLTVSSGNLSEEIALVATAQLPAPVITPADGTDTLITVTMSNTVADAMIYYTTDNSEPTSASNLYTDPIVLNTPGTYIYKAIAVKEGWENSEISTATYTIVEPVVPSIDTIMYSVGFEASEGFTATTNYQNADVIYSGAEGHQWGTVYGTPTTTDHICGAQSMQMRWYTSAANILGYTFTNFDIRNVTYVTFDAKQTNNLKLCVSYSVDGGNTYVGDTIYNLTNNRKNYRYNVSETGEYDFVRLKFAIVLPESVPTSTSRLTLDSVVVFGVPGIEVNMVETPVISPVGGTCYQPVNATITCATENAVIRYTLDGTEPTETSSEYSAPISISATTTLMAKAWKEGYTPSFVASTTFNFPPEVENIAAFKAASTTTNSTVYKITGDVNFVFRSGAYMFVEDASAALLIYDQYDMITTTYTEGDVISGGVFGSYTLFNGMVEMIPAQNTPAATGTPVTITPMTATIPTLVSQYSTFESRLVTIENVTFIGNKTFVNGTDTLKYYNRFGTVSNEPEVGDEGSITGFLAKYNGQVQLYPRNDNDFAITPPIVEQVATPVFSPVAGEYENNVEISISCATDNATIYYTLDGTEPNEDATEYTAPFTLTATTTVKAIAMKEGMLNSEVALATYTITTVGIRDMQQNVSIYPNPTTSNVTLDLSGLNAKTVELYSMNGQLLNTVVSTDETMTLSLSQYANGIYFARIHSDKGVTTQKIVKR